MPNKMLHSLYAKKVIELQLEDKLKKINDSKQKNNKSPQNTTADGQILKIIEEEVDDLV